jgi:hypothetical protein
VEHEHAVVRLPPGGGIPQVLWHGQDIEILGAGMAVDDRVYFSASTPQGRSVLFAVPRDGGPLQALADLGSPCGPLGVAIDAQRVYAATIGCLDGPSVLVRVPRTSGAPTTLLSSSTESIRWIAARDGTVYFLLGQRLMRIGSEETPVTMAMIDGISLALQATTVYVLTTDAVIAMPIQGGPPKTLAAGLSAANSIAVDDSGIYVAIPPPQGNGTILCLRPGNTPATLARVIGVFDLALSDANVYWEGWRQVGYVSKR